MLPPGPSNPVDDSRTDPRRRAARPDGAEAGRLARLFGIDRRSLALFRVGLGLLLVADLVKRALTLADHYSGPGAFPRPAALRLEPDSALFHLFLLSDEVRVQACLFLVFAAVALCLLVGYRTRLASFLALLLLVSLQRRNPHVCHTGDALLTALLFWSLFLPLGETYSVDRRRRGVGRGERTFLGLGTAALLLQIAVFYVFAGVLKHQNDEWVRGDALAIFCGISEYTRPFGVLLGRHELLARLLTWGTLFLEGLGPLLLFSPWGTVRLRVLVLPVFVAFHLGIQLAVYIGIFELLSIVALMSFLPGAVWERLGRTRLGARLGPRLAVWDEPAAGLPASSPREPSPLARPLAAGSAGVVLLALLVMGLSNVERVLERPLRLPAPGLYTYARQLGLVQNWNIFSRVEGAPHGWFVVLGQLEDGTVVDVLRGQPFTRLEARPDWSASYPNHNTRRLWWNARQRRDPHLPAYLADFLRRRAEAERGRPLLRLAILHVGSAPLSGDPVRARLVEEHDASAFRELARRLGRGTPAFLEALVVGAANGRSWTGAPHAESWRRTLDGVPAQVSLSALAEPPLRPAPARDRSGGPGPAR